MADAPDAAFGLPLTAGERLVLVLLWRFAPAGDVSPVVWPSAERLGQITGFGDRYVRRVLASLRAAGAIDRCDRPATAHSRGKAWRLLPDPLTRASEPVGTTDPGPQTRVQVTGSEPDPGPQAPPDPGPQARMTRVHRPPRSLIEAPDESSGESKEAQDPRLRLAAAIDAQTERYQIAARASPPPRMDPGVMASEHHRALRQRYQAALQRLPAHSAERTRLAACAPAPPLPLVLQAACDDLGGLDRVAEVLEWAWEGVAQGRITAFGRADAAPSLRDAFRGEGRLWRGIVEAYGRAQPRQVRLDEWRPRVTEGGEDMDAATFAHALEAIGR